MLPASLVTDHLRLSQFLISLPMVQLCLPTSWIQKCGECRNNLVQESLEYRLHCSSDLASSSDVGNGLSILAAPQSGHPNSNSRAHRVALLPKVETSHALNQLSALFQSQLLVSHESLLLIRTFLGLEVEI